METIYWLLGYEEEVKADERQKHLKHMACRQIEESKDIKLKKVKMMNKIEYKNRYHNKKPEHIDTKFEDDGFKPVGGYKYKKRKKKK